MKTLDELYNTLMERDIGEVIQYLVDSEVLINTQVLDWLWELESDSECQLIWQVLELAIEGGDL